MTWQLNFYDKKRKCFKRVNCHNHFTYANIYTPKTLEYYYLNTPFEYWIIMKSETDEMRFTGLLQPSFVEVFIGRNFVCRHYIRDYIIAPHIWYGDGEDPYISKQLIATKRMRNVVMDVFWGRVKRREWTVEQYEKELTRLENN